MALLFDWDPRKALLNETKHGVSFTEAGTVFSDRDLLIMPDPTHSVGEERFVAGFSAKGRLLLVVAKDLETDRLRIISARKATAAERADYERDRS